MSSEKKQNSFIFAAVLCLLTSVLLTGAAVGLKDRQDLNIKVDQQKNILKALGTSVEKGMSPQAVQSFYSTHVKDRYISASSEVTTTVTDFPIYLVENNSVIESYAIPFQAYGLWSWVYGYIAFEGDGDTVKGLTVYKHGETPGLGGEVEKDWFQKQFVGKKITDVQGGFVSIGIIKGNVEEKFKKEEQQNYVDGISGATLTSQGMEKYLKLEIGKYEKFAQKLRKENYEAH